MCSQQSQNRQVIAELEKEFTALSLQMSKLTLNSIPNYEEVLNAESKIAVLMSDIDKLSGVTRSEKRVCVIIILCTYIATNLEIF
jgi:uncharacterized protein YlaN (UPF0358 family)